MSGKTKSLFVVENASTGHESQTLNHGAAIGDNWRPYDGEQIFQLQIEQHLHDNKYHPEICRLSVHHRLNHLALHFAKYAGRIADACCSGNQYDIDRTLTDLFIIAISAANVLNLRLGKQLTRDMLRLAEQTNTQKFDLTNLLLVVTSASGKMAGACEAIDHLEARPLREEISAAVVTLAQSALKYAAQRNLDLVVSVRSRLEQVRDKKIFHGHV